MNKPSTSASSRQVEIEFVAFQQPRPRCETCVYYARAGECRIDPPGARGFPKVTAQHWCGRHHLFREWWEAENGKFPSELLENASEWFADDFSRWWDEFRAWWNSRQEGVQP